MRQGAKYSLFLHRDRAKSAPTLSIQTLQQGGRLRPDWQERRPMCFLCEENADSCILRWQHSVCLCHCHLRTHNEADNGTLWAALCHFSQFPFFCLCLSFPLLLCSHSFLPCLMTRCRWNVSPPLLCPCDWTLLTPLYYYHSLGRAFHCLYIAVTLDTFDSVILYFRTCSGKLCVCVFILFSRVSDSYSLILLFFSSGWTGLFGADCYTSTSLAWYWPSDRRLDKWPVKPGASLCRLYKNKQGDYALDIMPIAAVVRKKDKHWDCNPLTTAWH